MTRKYILRQRRKKSGDSFFVKFTAHYMFIEVTANPEFARQFHSKILAQRFLRRHPIAGFSPVQMP